MSKNVDWSGSWPILAFPGGFNVWLRRRLVLGLEVAAFVAAVAIGTAAKVAGFNIAWVTILATAFIAVLLRLQTFESDHAREHLDGR